MPFLFRREPVSKRVAPLKFRGFCIVLLACVAVALAPQPTSKADSTETPGVGLRIAPSKTWVGIARVYLEVSDLWLTDDGLRGRYRITVPLRPSENDSGTIELQPPASMNHLRLAGGILAGNAISDNGKMHDLGCTVRPDGSIRIEVATASRNLTFKSRFQTVRHP